MAESARIHKAPCNVQRLGVCSGRPALCVPYCLNVSNVKNYKAGRMFFSKLDSFCLRSIEPFVSCYLQARIPGFLNYFIFFNLFIHLHIWSCTFKVGARATLTTPKYINIDPWPESVFIDGWPQPQHEHSRRKVMASDGKWWLSETEAVGPRILNKLKTDHCTEMLSKRSTMRLQFQQSDYNATV